MPNSRSRQFDLIAFDWDGTLFDSTALITRCIQRAVVDVGGQEPTREAASYVIGMSLLPALAHAAPDVPKDKYPALGSATATITCSTSTTSVCLRVCWICWTPSKRGTTG
jgi:hypothetical protein